MRGMIEFHCFITLAVASCMKLCFMNWVLRGAWESRSYTNLIRKWQTHASKCCIVKIQKPLNSRKIFKLRKHFWQQHSKRWEGRWKSRWRRIIIFFKTYFQKLGQVPAWFQTSYANPYFVWMKDTGIFFHLFHLFSKHMIKMEWKVHKWDQSHHHKIHKVIRHHTTLSKTSQKGV